MYTTRRCALLERSIRLHTATVRLLLSVHDDAESHTSLRQVRTVASDTCIGYGTYKGYIRQ